MYKSPFEDKYGNVESKEIYQLEYGNHLYKHLTFIGDHNNTRPNILRFKVTPFPSMTK